MKPAISSWIARVLTRLGGLQSRRPGLPLLVGALLTVVGALLASRLELRTRFDQLLPDHQPSVVELRKIMARAGGQSNVFLVLEGEDSAVLRAQGDALVPKLQAIGLPWVTGAEDGIQAAKAFLEPRAGLFAETPSLTKLRDDIEARWDWEVARQTGSNLDDDAPPPPITSESIRSRFSGDRAGTADPGSSFPDGYFQSKDGRALVVVVHSTAAGGDLTRARETLARVREVVESTPHPNVSVSYAGDLVTGLSEYGAVRADLMGVGALGIAMVLTVVLLFFMRVRALVAMGVTIAAGLAWTFGATWVAIGHLNVATGFLFSIVAGNGINFGIIYMARYFEERRAGRTPAEAVVVAHRETWPSTLTAAVAAAAAYGSLGVTDFRAFKHFAFIGSFGMLACWLATVALIPPVLLLAERVAPFRVNEATVFGRLRSRGIRFDGLFTGLVKRAPRGIATVGAALALFGAALLVPYVKGDPMEYDVRRLQNDLGQSAEMYRASHLASSILGARLDGSMILAVDRLDQVEPLVHALDARRAAAPSFDRPFEAVHSLLEFIPEGQHGKVPLLLDIRDRLVRAHERGLIAESDWTAIAAKLPPEDLRAFGVDELPADVARPFTEQDGTRGRLVLVEPTTGKSDADLRYLLRCADALRETTLPSGEVVRGSGRAVIFADMLRSIVADIPHSIVLSLGLTVLAVLLTFRIGGRAFAVLASMAAGLGWVILAMVATHTKIQFFNFVALPITFGIGVDYAVNLVQRYEADGRRGVLHALRTTGGAIVLCSLTTTLGYLALLGSINQAIRGLGRLAVMGEMGCLLAAVLVLPAGLLWHENWLASRVKTKRLPSSIPLPAPSQPRMG